MPSLELLEAVVARARGDGTRVEVCVVVKWERIAGVPVAEDVATFAAVVATDKVAEVAFAGRVIADGGFSIGLDWQDVSMMMMMMISYQMSTWN